LKTENRPLYSLFAATNDEITIQEISAKFLVKLDPLLFG
jgi:hypothetical protein